jgi:hypothetical protein
VDLASINSTENLPLASAGHHSVPAKSTARAAEVHKGRATQAESAFQLCWALSAANRYTVPRGELNILPKALIMQ